ncbi:hypothetical protein SASPL_102958 [Salvia splendens]|uniref:Uncharacterized protein n=1 Tax=Salvia splendens TaxID=180675 RepID=A0A8X8YUR9_SALSN|nr:hypothetical protein SASPL_102958 [Salvia splendens]
MREMKKEKAEARDYHGRGWGPGATWREADGVGFAFLAGICFSAKPNNVTLDKFDAWRDDTDRRFENLETEPPSGFDDDDDWDYEDVRRQRSGDRGLRGRNPSGGFREGPHEDRARRDSGGRNGPGWTTQGNRHPSQQFGRVDQSYDRTKPCWDPHQLYQANTRGFDGQQRVKMEPPQAATGSGQAPGVEDVCGDDASNSDTTGVSISSIALLGEKHGVEEDRAVSPADYQVSASKEIYWSCSSDVNSILSTAPLSAATLLSDVDRDFKCLLQGHTQDEWDIGLVANGGSID